MSVTNFKEKIVKPPSSDKTQPTTVTTIKHQQLLNKPKRLPKVFYYRNTIKNTAAAFRLGV